jgi:hypothetical protein
LAATVGLRSDRQNSVVKGGEERAAILPVDISASDRVRAVVSGYRAAKTELDNPGTVVAVDVSHRGPGGGKRWGKDGQAWAADGQIGFGVAVGAGAYGVSAGQFVSTPGENEAFRG